MSAPTQNGRGTLTTPKPAVPTLTADARTRGRQHLCEGTSHGSEPNREPGARGVDHDVARGDGHPVADRATRYQRAHESIQIVQELWGSWEQDAWLRDTALGRFADPAKIQPIEMGGRYVASRGPLPIPPSEQGQPVIFQAGGGANGLVVAGRYASGVMGQPHSIEDAVAERARIREAVARAGRDPDEIKYFAGVMPAIAPTKRAALDRRLSLSEQTFPQRLAHLEQMLGIRMPLSQLDQPLSQGQLAAAQASPHDPRSAHALKIAREGWSVRDVLAHGVIDYHPVVPGPPEVLADFMQEWFEAGACDGFWFIPDVYEDAIDAFVDGVVPILQERGLFHQDYEGTTLRDHLGAAPQYGIDARLTG